MKMEAVGKAEQLDSEVPPKTSEKQETASDEDRPIELKTQTRKDNMPTAAGSVVLSSMPCLLMELRRDSLESQLAFMESHKPTDGQVYESDSSIHCMLSPSSSGHLADSDTLSSTEENEHCQAEAAVEGDSSVVSGAAVGRKSRRSRSESETSTMAAKKNRQSSDKQNGQVTKVKGYRSKKHKERIRLLRQKREAAARRKYNLLQDSSTSDSDLTCDSSMSSSDDDEVSGSSKTITAEISDGPPVVAHYDISDTNSDPEVVNVDNLLAAAVVQKHSNSLGNQDSGSAWRTRGLLDELGTDTDGQAKISQVMVEDPHHKQQMCFTKWAHQKCGHLGEKATYRRAQDCRIVINLDIIKRVIAQCPICQHTLQRTVPHIVPLEKTMQY
ncbi:protein ARK2N-like isoform X1 [Lathamus discolor]|uniref:protein ARK2N-like isoform X1 n=1 Tax=Lathamus discolor TaxID=678569 RepID=UPI0032B8132E